jgi:hypothetical protein
MPLGYFIGGDLPFLKILVIFVMLAYKLVDHKKGITFSSTPFLPVKVPFFAFGMEKDID